MSVSADPLAFQISLNSASPFSLLSDKEWIAFASHQGGKISWGFWGFVFFFGFYFFYLPLSSINPQRPSQTGIKLHGGFSV